MKEKLYYQNTHLIYEVLLKVPYKPEYIWQFLTMTDKLACWFPEIKTGELNKNGYLLFEMDKLRIEMDIIYFEENKILAYRWDSGQVEFHLESTNNSTHLFFKNTLPEEFPDRVNDITGWSVELNRLMNALDGKVNDFENKDFKEIKASYQSQIDALNK